MEESLNRFSFQTFIDIDIYGTCGTLKCRRGAPCEQQMLNTE